MATEQEQQQQRLRKLDEDLINAVKTNTVSSTEDLIKSGASVNAAHIPYSYEKTTPLHAAALRNAVDCARILIKHGAHLHALSSGSTPTQIAQQLRQVDIFLFLHQVELDQAATLDIVKQMDVAKLNDYHKSKPILTVNFREPTPSGFSPLHWAVSLSKEKGIEMVSALLQLGADPNFTDSNQQTPLHIAALQNQDEAIPLLLKHGANIDARRQDHSTPLVCALMKGHESCVFHLYEQGANIHVQNTDGQHPIIKKTKHNPVISLETNSGVQSVHNQPYQIDLTSSMRYAKDQGSQVIVQKEAQNAISVDVDDLSGSFQALSIRDKDAITIKHEPESSERSQEKSSAGTTELTQATSSSSLPQHDDEKAFDQPRTTNAAAQDLATTEKNKPSDADLSPSNPQALSNNEPSTNNETNEDNTPSAINHETINEHSVVTTVHDTPTVNDDVKEDIKPAAVNADNEDITKQDMKPSDSKEDDHKEGTKPTDEEQNSTINDVKKDIKVAVHEDNQPTTNEGTAIINEDITKQHEQSKEATRPTNKDDDVNKHIKEHNQQTSKDTAVINKDITKQDEDVNRTDRKEEEDSKEATTTKSTNNHEQNATINANANKDVNEDAKPTDIKEGSKEGTKPTNNDEQNHAEEAGKDQDEQTKLADVAIKKEAAAAAAKPPPPSNEAGRVFTTREAEKTFAPQQQRPPAEREVVKKEEKTHHRRSDPGYVGGSGGGHGGSSGGHSGSGGGSGYREHHSSGGYDRYYDRSKGHDWSYGWYGSYYEPQPEQPSQYYGSKFTPPNKSNPSSKTVSSSSSSSSSYYPSTSSSASVPAKHPSDYYGLARPHVVVVETAEEIAFKQAKREMIETLAADEPELQKNDIEPVWMLFKLIELLPPEKYSIYHMLLRDHAMQAELATLVAARKLNVRWMVIDVYQKLETLHDKKSEAVKLFQSFEYYM